MSNAANGEPLALRHAVALYSAQSVYGTAVLPATSLGACLAAHDKNVNIGRVRGPGSKNVLAVKQVGIHSQADLRWEMAQSGIKTFLLKAVRANGVLPLITLGIGYQDDVTPTPNRSSAEIQDCKFQRLQLGLDCSSGAAPLTASATLLGGLVTPLTTLAPATLSTTPWASWEGVVTDEGSAYQLRSIDCTIEHTLSMDHVVPGTAPSSFKGGHKYLTEHDETITGTISRYAPLGFDVQAATVPERDLVLVLTNTEDSVALTLTLNDCSFNNERFEPSQQGLFWSAAFEAKSFSLA